MAAGSLLAHFAAMARNNAWSNYRLHKACAELSAADYITERTNFFPTIQRTLDHILVVDRLYLDALEGQPKPGISYDGALGFDFAVLRDAQKVEDQRLIAFCTTLAPENINTLVKMLRESGVKFDSVGTVLPHLFIHQIHHRGQVHAMLAGTSVSPPQLDEFFLEEDVPRRRDDLIALEAGSSPAP